MKNLIEKISIKTGLTKLEVTALLFIFASIITGVGLHLAGVGRDETPLAEKEKSTWDLLKKAKDKEKEEKVEVSELEVKKGKRPPYKVHLNRGGVDDFDQIPGVPRSLAELIVEMRVDSSFVDFHDLISRLDKAGIYYVDFLEPWIIKKDE